MSNTDASRIFVQEGAYTFRKDRLDDVLLEIDKRTSGQSCYSTITRIGGLISKVEYFRDPAKTSLSVEKVFSRSTGLGGIKYLTGAVIKFFNENGSEDSVITETISRPGIGVTTDNLVGCLAPFTTTEDDKL